MPSLPNHLDQSKIVFFRTVMDSSLDSCSAASELSSSVLVLLSSVITPSIDNFPCFCHYPYLHCCPLHVLAMLSSVLLLTSKLVCVRYSAKIALNRLNYMHVSPYRSIFLIN